MGWVVKGSNSQQRQNTFLFSKHSEQLWSPSSFPRNGYAYCKCLVHAADQSPPSSAKVKNECSCTYTSCMPSQRGKGWLGLLLWSVSDNSNTVVQMLTVFGKRHLTIHVTSHNVHTPCPFWGIFAKWQKAPISSLICLSVQMEQLIFHWMYFHDIWYLHISLDVFSWYLIPTYFTGCIFIIFDIYLISMYFSIICQSTSSLIKTWEECRYGTCRLV
jgi:hypothetical protein